MHRGYWTPGWEDLFERFKELEHEEGTVRGEQRDGYQLSPQSAEEVEPRTEIVDSGEQERHRADE